MPTIDIPDKVCSHCGGIRWTEIKCRYKTRDGIKFYRTYKCTNKSSEDAYRWRKNHPDKDALYNERAKIYHKTPEGKESMKRAKRTQIKKLTDYHIINNIASQLCRSGIKLDRKSVTKEQIEIYRKSISLQRQLKQLKQCQL